MEELMLIRILLFLANEADLLNLIIFGCTAKDWEQMNPELAKKGYNLRNTATINQLVVLSNIEARNSELLKQHGLIGEKRRAILHQIAKEQFTVLNTNNVEQKNLESYWVMTPKSLSRLYRSNFKTPYREQDWLANYL